MVSTGESKFWLVAGAALLLCWISALALTTPSAGTPQRTLPPASSSTADEGSQSNNGPPLSSFEEEMRAKRAIRLAEKEHEQHLKRAREISKLGKELQTRFTSLSKLDRDGVRRLERLEQLTKKIRGEVGGKDNDVKIENRPGDKQTAMSQIAQVADSLSKTVLDTPRQVVSTAVIESSNVLLELIRIFRSLPK